MEDVLVIDPDSDSASSSSDLSSWFETGTEIEPPELVNRMERRFEEGAPRGRSTTTMPPTSLRAPVRNTKSAPQRYTTLMLNGFFESSDPGPCCGTIFWSGVCCWA